METLNNRFRKLETALVGLVEQYRVRNQINEEKKAVAQELIGSVYYWGDYSGTVIPHNTDPTKVIAHLTHQKTGIDCHWSFDAFKVMEHVLSIQQFNSWQEYHDAIMLRDAADYEQMMIGFKFSEERITKEMQAFCTKFNVPYKSYLQGVA